MKLKIFLGLLLIGLILAGTGYYLFQKKVTPLDEVKADFKLTADELYNAFETDETAANQKFVDKVIEVTGTVDRFTKQEAGANIVLSAENAIAGGVNCSFSIPPTKVEPGTMLTIKGRCQGLLLDVVLNNCSVVPSTL